MSTILVVDDDKLIRILLYRILSKMGHIVLEAENGMEAVRICRLFNFDLVILDYQMPDMDGLEVVKRLGDKRPPFVLHTTDYDNNQVIENAINAKALGIIGKFSNINDFKQEITCFLEQK